MVTNPISWFESHLVVKCLSGIPSLPIKWDSFFIQLGLHFFLEKKRIMFTTSWGKYSVMFASWLNIRYLKKILSVFFSTRVSKKDQMECTPEVDKVNSSIKCVALFYVYCPLTLICKRCDSGDERNYFFFPCLSISEIDELKNIER